MGNNIFKFDILAQILSNIEVAEEHFKMKLACPQIAAHAQPGQFVHLLINERYDPLLRRPFTIYRAKNGNIEILFQVVGRGTRLLAQKQSSDTAKVMGPLGNGFVIPGELETALLVGGGVGIASLMMLAENLRKEGKRVIGLIGAQNSNRILCVDEFRAIGAEVYLSTDDGSCGHRGFVTELLLFSVELIRLKTKRKILENPEEYRLSKNMAVVAQKAEASFTTATQSEKNADTVIYACGPDGMLKSVAEIAEEKNIPAKLALENRMACGLGACLGCVVKIKDTGGGVEYKRVCVDGPIFDAREIVWE